MWQCRETYCSLTTKMQLSCEGNPDTGCLQVTFRSLWLQREKRKDRKTKCEWIHRKRFRSKPSESGDLSTGTLTYPSQQGEALNLMWLKDMQSQIKLISHRFIDVSGEKENSSLQTLTCRTTAPHLFTHLEQCVVLNISMMSRCMLRHAGT